MLLLHILYSRKKEFILEEAFDFGNLADIAYERDRWWPWREVPRPKACQVILDKDDYDRAHGKEQQSPEWAIRNANEVHVGSSRRMQQLCVL